MKQIVSNRNDRAFKWLTSEEIYSKWFHIKISTSQYSTITQVGDC